MPRVIATDLDGTLLRSDGTISARTRGVLREIESAGIDIVFVTARPVRWLGDVADAVSKHGHVICLGGACVVSLGEPDVTIVEYEGFATDIAASVVADLRQEIRGVLLGAERGSGPVFDDEFPARRSPGGSPVRSGDVARGGVEASLDLPEPIAKLLVRHPALGTADLHAAVREIVKDRAVHADSGAGGLAELFPAGVSKSNALARWCAGRGVRAEDVWAFGDMPADIPMLAWAGRSFAVGAAHPDVVAAATTVAPSNDEDGVARVLAALLG